MRQNMSPTGAYLLITDNAGPDGEVVYRTTGIERYLVVTVPDEAAAAEIARRLASEEEVTLFELCGGFSAAGVAGVRAAVDPETVAVGAMSFAFDSLSTAARFSANVEAALTAART